MKHIVLILTVLILLFALAACGGDPVPPQTEPAKPAQTEVRPAETGSTDPNPAETGPADTLPAETGPAETQTTENPDPETQPPDTQAPETEPEPPEPLILVDDDVCRVEVLRMDEDEIWGFQVFLRLENKTDTTLLFSMESCAVQGYFTDPSWITQVNAGQIKESDFNIFQNTYERCGFSRVEELCFRLIAKDFDHYSASPLLDEEIALYPTGKTAEEVGHPEREPQDTDILIAEDDRFTVVLTQIDPEGLWGYTWEVYLENHTDQPLTFNWKDLEINGVSFEPYWLADMPAGLKGYALLSVSRDELKEKNVEAPSEFDFVLNIYNSRTYKDISAERCAVVLP